jgi:hypothetical protein
VNEIPLLALIKQTRAHNIAPMSGLLGAPHLVIDFSLHANRPAIALASGFRWWRKESVRRGSKLPTC